MTFSKFSKTFFEATMKYIKQISIFAALLTFFVVSSCNDDSNEPTKTQDISGIISDSAGEPIAAALVDALDAEEVILATDSTDSEGKFTLAELPEDLEGIDIRIQKEGYQTYRGAIAGIKGEDNALDMQMQKDGEGEQDSCCKGVLVVFPKDSASGEAISSGYAKLWQGEKIIQKAEFNNNKAFFDGICEGEYVLSVHSEGYKTYEGKLEFACNDTLEKEILLVESEEDGDCYGVLNVCVIDKNDNELEDVLVLINKNSYVIDEAYTNENNACVSFEDLCKGKYWVRVDKIGYQKIDKELYFEEGDTLELTVKLYEEGDTPYCNVVEVCVTDENNKPIDDVNVWLYRPNDIQVGVKYTSSENPCVVFENLWAGTFFIRLTHPDYKVIEKEIELGDCDTLKIEKQMVREEDDCCGVVEICVTDADGGMIDDVDIRLYQGEKKLGLKYTDGKNPCVIFEDLCAGNYWFRIYKSGYEVIEKEFELGKCDTLEFSKKLEAKDEEPCDDASLKVKVKDQEAYEYISGIKVKLYKGDVLIESGNTNESGYIIFDGLTAPAEYTAYVPETDKYNSGQFTIGFEKCVEKQETLWLTPKESEKDTCCKGVLYVIAKDKATGEKITEGKIKLWLNGEMIETAIMKDGVAVIDGICEGKYGVDVYGNGYKTKEFTYEHPCNKEKEFVVELEKE
jgi:hypothetical protein